MDNQPPTPLQRQFPCTKCGAKLEFMPGTDSLVCSHCGALNKIAESGLDVPLLDYELYIQQLPQDDAVHETLVVHCAACGAESHLAPDVTADRCKFCGSAVVAESQSKKAIKPMALLPFIVNKQQADKLFHQWVEGLWFAPSALAKQAERSGIDGAYIPAWTYNAQTVTQYTGQRGDDYQEMETYTEFVNGRPETRTRMVTRTRWSYASGVVQDRFANLLVLATQSLPAKQAQHLQPWDLQNLIPYADEYLSGMTCQSYQVDLANGFSVAKEMMVPVIRQTIESDIGGNHQRIDSAETQYQSVKFRHLLLPLWISAYKFGPKTYRFLINARTGEVQGERPYSGMKITLLILAILAAIAVIVLIFMGAQGGR
jgi:DNA-directed RNA polymerase subunit RPC12/RpoP